MSIRSARMNEAIEAISMIVPIFGEAVGLEQQPTQGRSL